ncbi:MAG TPA: hypothetical protein DFH97_01980 [Clostridiales bacterium]|nr:hypothetical protein [Clostridiales bacterium]HCI63811.1 hypothetical protein [Clostridiales bacterium]
MKRLVAFFLTLALLVSCVPAALAAQAETPEEAPALLEAYETTEETTEAPTEATEETTIATEATEEATEAPTNATEAATEAAEATETTEAPTEATEETTEAPTETTEETTATTEETTEATTEETTEATTEETLALLEEEEPEEDQLVEKQTEDFWIYNANVYWRYDSASKLSISWDAKEDAASYALYELIYKNGRQTEKKIGTTNTAEITIKAPKYWHDYLIYPCSAPNGKGERGDAASFGDWFPPQDWRKAPKLTVKQDTYWENYVEVKCNYVPGAAEFLLKVDDAEYRIDDYGRFIDSDDNEDKADLPKVEVKETAQDKGYISFWVGVPTGRDDRFTAYTSEVSCTAFGVTDSEGTMESGTRSKVTKVKITPLWNKAPKISVKQTYATEPTVTLRVNFNGEPDYFDIYDNGNYVETVDAGWYGSSTYELRLNSYAEDDPGYQPVGNHTFKVVPVIELDEDGSFAYGKASSSKKVKVKISWKTDKIKVKAKEAEAGLVSLDWNDIPGVDGYQVWRQEGKGKIEDLGFVENPFLDYIPVQRGIKYTFTVKAVFNGEFSNGSSVKITPKKKPKAQPDYADSTYRALLIGNYYDGDLPGCDRDANTMENMLKSMTATPYNAITKIIDADADEILSSISRAFRGAKNSDVSLFYYSGHGAGKTGDLIGADWYGVSFKRLRAELDKIPGDKIVILDSCYSGNAINKSEAEEETEMEAYVDAAVEAFSNSVTPKAGELSKGRYYVITACRKNQTSLSVGDGQGNSFGLFTKYFEEACGWDEVGDCSLDMIADFNQDGMIALNEAYRKTSALVSAWADGDSKIQVTRVNPEYSSFILFGRK